jgi:hypothetical protein
MNTEIGSVVAPTAWSLDDEAPLREFSVEYLNAIQVLATFVA